MHLRFRAPEKMNDIIDELCREFKDKIVPIDSIFNAASPNGIVGNNLMVDHLHPNLRGYKLIGKSFYEAMVDSGNLPKDEEPNLPFEIQDSVTNADFMITELDSITGNDMVTLLKNDWPFVKKSSIVTAKNLFHPKNFIDSLAIEYIEGKITWPDAHLEAATFYLRKDEIKNYLKYMNAIIYQYPNLKDFNSALRYFYEQKKVTPSDYTTKRIGLIALYRKEYESAIHYLTQKDVESTKDPQVIYGLALAYFKTSNLKSALEQIDKCLAIKPGYQEAQKLKLDIIESKQKL